MSSLNHAVQCGSYSSASRGPLDMRKFCPNSELTRLTDRISMFHPPNTQEHTTTQRRKKCSRTTGGMVLIRNFHVYKSKGTRHVFETSTLRIAVLHLTNCAMTTTFQRFSESLLSYQYTFQIESNRDHKKIKK